MRLCFSVKFWTVLALGGAAPIAAHSTLQQQFEAASRLTVAEEWEPALKAYEALEQRLKASPNARTKAIIRVRKGEALTRLGRLAEARAELEGGLAGLPANDVSLHEERTVALLSLGALAERALQFPEAYRYYASAENVTDPGLKGRALVGKARSGAFVDAARAVADADRAIGWASAQGDLAKDTHGELLTLKGRALLNAGQFAEAYRVLKTATSKLGGLTLKVSAADLIARSDLAIAALLSGDKSGAREYLAYTGAGRLDDQFLTAVSMDPPPCGEAGLVPSDVGVVELSIGGDGSVSRAAPIYSSGGGAKAVAFAAAASRWSWTSEQVAKIPALFRAVTRVEMRCSAEPDREKVVDVLRAELHQWAEARGFGYPAELEKEGFDRSATIAAASELRAREAKYGLSAVELLPVLQVLACDPRNTSERLAINQRALAIARAAKAPPGVIALFALDVEFGKTALAWAAQAENPPGEDRWARPDYDALLKMPEIAGDRRSALAVRLLAMRDALAREKKAEAGRILQDARLTAADSGDPIGAAALMQLASLKKQPTLASAAAGPASETCPLAEGIPPLVRTGAGHEDYPQEALNWGFEGWAAVEYSIDPNGKTSASRTVITHPPFVFGGAAEKMSRVFRFEPSVVPLPQRCSIKRSVIRFKWGGRR